MKPIQPIAWWRPNAWWIVSIATQIGAAMLVRAFGSREPIPLHFDWSGHPDAWGGRSEVALIILALAATTTVITIALPILTLTPGGGDGLASPPKPTARGLVLAIFPLISAFLAATALGAVPTSATTLFLLVSLLSLVLGLWLGKLEPNPVVGVRTYWTLRSRLAWDKSNRLFGRVAFWSGLVGLLASPVAPEPLGLRVLVAVVIGAAVLAVFESWRVWRGDPERLSRG